MAAKVEIIVTAKDAASQVLRGVASNFGELGNAVQALTSGAGLEYLTAQVVKFGKESVDATVAYADEVRNLSQITGQGAEETSRLIQLSDDYKVSVQDLTLASKTLAKDGIGLSTETLAKLSDEYLKLAPGQERATFLMDKFGRSGYKMAELMQQGGDAVRAMSGAIDENLVLTDEAVQQARQYEKAMDSLEEQTLKLQYALGKQLVPAMTDFVTAINNSSEKTTNWEEIIMNLAFPVLNFESILRAVSEAHKQNAVAAEYDVEQMRVMRDVVPELNQELEQNEIDIKAVTAANQQLLQSVQTVAGEETRYASEINGLQNERIALQQQIAATPAWDTTQIAEYQGKLDELVVKEGEVTAAYKQAAAERIFSIVEQKLAVDGLTDSETDYLLKIGEGMGIFTQEQVDATKKQLDEAQKLADGYKTFQNQMTTEEQKRFATSGEQWRLYTETVKTELDTNILAINQYIDALTSIPASIQTTVTVLTQTAPAGTASTSMTTTTATNNYYIQNAYLAADGGVSVI